MLGVVLVEEIHEVARLRGELCYENVLFLWARNALAKDIRGEAFPVQQQFCFLECQGRGGPLTNHRHLCQSLSSRRPSG